ncbi:interferon gamma [Xenopus laevis]|uniref:Interferon gamma n=2 Tax=Xenopus laevis TaxID=8355 RepID=A0A974D9Z8_XENLA|nr:interferon gamma [Xenopus laevis]OCT87490.1 hypothetical protein XELAEV_18021184mg [Xenopus laevis]
MRQSYRLLCLSVIIYFVGHISGFSVNLKDASIATEEMRKHFKSIDHEGDNNGLVFQKFFDSWKEEGEKKILLSQIVPVYLKIIDAISKMNLKNEELQPSIRNLKMMLNTIYDDLLKQTDLKLRGLNGLKTIQVEDVKTQHAAIKELFMVLRELSVMEDTKNQEVKKQKRDFQRKDRRRRYNTI